MKNKEFMKLNIQLFAEEAANADETESENVDDVELDGDDADTKVDDTPIDKTKAFSERLKTKTEEIEKSYQDKLNSVAKQQGFKNWDEFEKATEKQTMEELGVQDQEKFQRFVNNAIDKNPDVIKAREIIKKSEESERERALNADLEKISKLDKTIKTMDDLAKQENVQEIIDRLKRGYTLYDAYCLTNMSKIQADTLDAAKQNAIDDVNSKSHMKTSTGGNGKTTYVPKDVYEMYRRNMPKWSDEQIRDHYSKTMGE